MSQMPGAFLTLRPSWFEQAFGFSEPNSYDKVRKLFRAVHSNEAGNTIRLETVPPEGLTARTFFVGKFDTPSVGELRTNYNNNKSSSNTGTNTCTGLTFQHIVAGVGDLHRDPQNHGAVFQAASQFNCLEMVSPSIRPEDGITRYQNDHTQGPTCAMAAPAATVYRNYFWKGKGQGHGHQMDLLEDFGDLVGNYIPDGTTGNPRYWKMKNGYALPATPKSIRDLRQDVLEQSTFDREQAVSELRIGVHWGTQVQLPEDDVIDIGEKRLQLVAQVFCSALPIGYDATSSDHDWEPFAQIVLDGAYEATLLVASILSRQRQGARVKVFLTMLGGGVFKNQSSWIASAIRRALEKYQHDPLDVVLIHYGRIDKSYVEPCGSFPKP